MKGGAVNTNIQLLYVIVGIIGASMVFTGLLVSVMFAYRPEKNRICRAANIICLIGGILAATAFLSFIFFD